MRSIPVHNHINGNYIYMDNVMDENKKVRELIISVIANNISIGSSVHDGFAGHWLCFV